jgi:uncharacterized membrane protein (DUF2068 family)
MGHATGYIVVQMPFGIQYYTGDTIMKRSVQITIAAILNALVSLANIVMTIPLLAMGAEAVNQQAAVENPPFFILVLAMILGVIGVIGSWGLWQNQRWAKIVVILINALGGLSALPGVILAETTALRMSAIVGVGASLVIIVLLLWPSPRTAPEMATS